MKEERESSIEINKSEFRKIEYELIDTISDFITIFSTQLSLVNKTIISYKLY